MEKKVKAEQANIAKKESDIEEVKQVLDKMNPKERNIIQGAFVAMEQRMFSGPLPSPEDFKAYGEAMQDAPQRILNMAEKQSEHRMIMERKLLNRSTTESVLGQIIGFLIAILFLGAAVWLGMSDHDVLAGAIVTAISSLIIVFVLKKNPKDKD